MRYVQAGILACLVTIAGLLFAIYREQAAPVAAPEPALELTEIAAPQTSEEVVAVKYASLREEPSAAAPAASPKPRPRPAQAPPAVEIAPPQPAPVPEVAPPPVIEAVYSPALTEERSAIEKPIADPPPIPARTVTLGVGSPLRVRLSHTLSTQRNEPGDSFAAVLDEPIIQDGLIVADKGARVEGRVVDARRAGRVKGLSYLAVELTTLHTDDGQQVPIVTSQFAQEGPKTQREDLEKVGIGAGVGAVIGAIAGGGKGAAIGAATGAGAGAGTAAVTRGEPVVLRPETRLDFQLDEPVTITEQL